MSGVESCGSGGGSDDSDNDDDAIYRELTSFLSSPRNDVRKAAASAALAALSSASYAGRAEAARRLTSLNAIVPMCRIASMSSQGECGSNDALRALLIMCSDDVVGDQCVMDFVGGGDVDDGDYDEVGGGGKRDGRGIARMLEIALSNPPAPAAPADSRSSSSSSTSSERAEWTERVDCACALLANATRTERGAAEFVGLSLPDVAVPTSSSPSSVAATTTTKEDARPTATLLLSRFLNPAYVDVESEGYASATRAWGGTNALSGDDDDDDDDEDDYVGGCGGGGRRVRRSSSDARDDDREPPATTTARGSRTSVAKVANSSGGATGCYDPYQHVAAVVMNICQLERGRDFLMRLIPDGANGATTSRLQSLLPQLATSPNPVRRRGVAGTIKNCCFSQDSAWWLLNVVRIDKALLLPLAGPEELSVDEKVGLDPDYWLLGPLKAREPDAEVRLYVVEALLLLLASGRRARDTLRERRTYVIVKLADMVEEDEGVTERLLECVQYLRRDEDGTEEGSSDRRAYEAYTRGMLETDVAKNRNKSVVDYDNVD